MATGDEKYLPMRDRGPQKRYVRDYVDARFSVGELLIPLMFARDHPHVLPAARGADHRHRRAVGVLPRRDRRLSSLLGFLLNRKLAAKFGADRVEKVRWYAAMRALQLRLMRLPKPQVKRGQYPA